MEWNPTKLVENIFFSFTSRNKLNQKDNHKFGQTEIILLAGAKQGRMAASEIQEIKADVKMVVEVNKYIKRQ